MDELVEAGYEALARGAWADARSLFEDALGHEQSAEAWEGLGWAGFWLSDEALILNARERAYRAYRERGDRGSAARAAAWLASDFAEFSGPRTRCRASCAASSRIASTRSDFAA